MSKRWLWAAFAVWMFLFIAYADGAQGERRKDGAWVICDKPKPGTPLLEFCVVFTTETGTVVKPRKLVATGKP